MSSPDELLDAFLAGEIPAIYDSEESVIIYDQLPHDENDWECCSVGERIDLDNDGENEQIVNGPYGGVYFDGGGNIVDEFELGAEYRDSTDDKYDENSDFTFRDEKISMSEYEELRKEIIGW